MMSLDIRTLDNCAMQWGWTTKRGGKRTGANWMRGAKKKWYSLFSIDRVKMCSGLTSASMYFQHDELQSKPTAAPQKKIHLYFMVRSKNKLIFWLSVILKYNQTQMAGRIWIQLIDCIMTWIRLIGNSANECSLPMLKWIERIVKIVTTIW